MTHVVEVERNQDGYLHGRLKKIFKKFQGGEEPRWPPARETEENSSKSSRGVKAKKMVYRFLWFD